MQNITEASARQKNNGQEDKIFRPAQMIYLRAFYQVTKQREDSNL